MLFIDWQPALEIFSIGNFAVRWYSFFWCIGLALAYIIVQKLYKQQQIDNAKFEPLFLYCFFGVLIGARLGHCIFYEPETYLTSFRGVVEMLLPIRFDASGEWHFAGYSGLASHGGVIGVVIGLLLYIRKTKLPFMLVLDSLGIASPIFAAMVRLGNLMNSEIIGLPTDAAWGFIFTKTGIEVPCHPAQLYESLAYLTIFIVILILYRVYRNKVGTGLFAGFTLFTIFTFRFFVEYIKDNQVAFEDGMVLNMGQILSIPLVIAGGYLIYRSTRNKA
jgi:prolipoprotein diacylglyceryl transferase